MMSRLFKLFNVILTICLSVLVAVFSAVFSSRPEEDVAEDELTNQHLDDIYGLTDPMYNAVLEEDGMAPLHLDDAW